MGAGLRSWWTRWAWGAATLCVLLPCPDAVGQDVLQAGDLTDEHIVKAIDVLVDELYRQQRKNRFWDPTTPELKADGGGWKMMDPQKPGWTALAVLALLHAGESYQEPRLRSAISTFRMSRCWARTRLPRGRSCGRCSPTNSTASSRPMPRAS